MLKNLLSVLRVTVKFKGSRDKFKQSMKKAIFSSYKSVHVFFFFPFLCFFLFYIVLCLRLHQTTSFSDFVTNSHGESRNSPRKRSVSQNYWVPVQKTMSPKRNFFVLNFFFGLYVTMQIINLKTDSETLHYSLLEIKRTPSIIKHDKD